jgi:adenylate cyclase
VTSSVLTLDTPEVMACLEGLIPASIGSASRDGIPNVTWLSIVHRLDSTHLGISRQFLRKTSSNMEENLSLQLLMFHPRTGVQYHFNLQHERTETAGTHYDRMRTQLEAIASQSGMSAVFKLAGIDVCQVVSIEEVPDEQPDQMQLSQPEVALHERLYAFSEQANAAKDVDDLIRRSLDALESCFGYEHSFLLVADPSLRSLYTVGSHGYASSGAGSEVNFGEGYIGVAAERRQPVLASNLAKDHAYATSVRSGVTRAGEGDALQREIPVPGLSNAMSQLAVPVQAAGQLLGVLCLQSEVAGAFLSADEHVASIVATQLGLGMAILQSTPTVALSSWRIATPPAAAPSSAVRHYRSDDSVFIDDVYLIKGVAGAVLWRLLREYSERNRTDFSNKEMRLDQSLELPDINSNLESRLILLRRRLQDQCHFIQIVKTGRGHFRLNVERPLQLQELP